MSNNKKKIKEYNHLIIEKKWQKEWEKKKIYQASNTSKKKKFYCLVEFPYPSGAGLHVGHPRSYVGMDIVSRKKRMDGYNVLYPMGWDAFGLPTENYAIKTGIHPEKVTKQNTDIFRRQIKMLGASFDWSREINTTDPAYYKWTQWLFLKFFEKGLAYKSKSSINWCPSCKIGLANEEVIDGACERCEGKTEKREKEQWMLAITKYAERLDKDLDLVDYPYRVKAQQRNWIGKSEGSEIDFKIHLSRPSPYQGEGKGEVLKVFTTRADTLFGVTYVVLAPEHPLISNFKSQISNWNEVLRYIEVATSKTEIERTSDNEKTKTGVPMKGVKAINPANGEEVPVWVADYVLPQYGTGAVMAVPAHDERDFEFAKKRNLPIKNVIARVFGESKADEKERYAVAVFVKRPSDGKYLFIFAKAFNEVSKVYGGIEENEKASDAAIREVFEETGYKTKFVRDFGISTQSHFFHPHKKENRRLVCRLVELELIDEKQYEITQEEKSLHEILWLDYNEAKQKINDKKELYDFEIFEGKNCFTEEGVLVNSNKFNNLNSKEAIKKITEFVGGKMVTKFKLRDWVFSRQRYWGEPIPLVYCPSCAKASSGASALADKSGGKENSGWIPVPKKELPLKLPKVKSYKLTDTGESPLANITKWVNTKCPVCKGPAKRETDTMPNWAGSSWYYLRYTDDKNKKEFASQKNLKYWLTNKKLGSSTTKGELNYQPGGVDWYNGGMEHTTLHLLYSRFWHKFFYDLKLVPTSEPYMKRTSHGMILAEGGEKMSKSKGNVVNPDEIVKNYGADTLRVYEMFMGPFDQAVAWSSESIIGPRRFLERTWKLGQKVIESAGGKRSDLKGVQGPTLKSQQLLSEKIIHKTIKKVGEDIEVMAFNTCVSSMMVCLNELEKNENISVKDFKMFLQVLAPFAPHIAEELWMSFGEKKSIHLSAWPKYDPKKIVDSEVKIAIQINGKVRAEITVPADLDEAKIKEIVIFSEEVKKYLENKVIKRFIYVKNKLVNIVV